jgi:hypothetical protein
MNSPVRVLLRNKLPDNRPRTAFCQNGLDHNLTDAKIKILGMGELFTSARTAPRTPCSGRRHPEVLLFMA